MKNKKNKSNRQIFTAAIKELSDIDLVILRERILTVCEFTIENKEAVTKEMKNGFISPDLIIGACERVFEKFDFKD
jgi:hypothetical protein